MTKAFAVATLFLGSFAIVFAAIIAIALTSKVSADEPIYRLDARYHNLPARLVAELLAHPPRRAPLAPYLLCQTADIDGESVGYCICFDRETCATAPHFPGKRMPWGYEQWVCTNPVGAIDDRGMGVCRARDDRVVITGERGTPNAYSTATYAGRDRSRSDNHFIAKSSARSTPALG